MPLWQNPHRGPDITEHFGTFPNGPEYARTNTCAHPFSHRHCPTAHPPLTPLPAGTAPTFL
jgi:hypothetical protein